MEKVPGKFFNWTYNAYLFHGFILSYHLNICTFALTALCPSPFCWLMFPRDHAINLPCSSPRSDIHAKLLGSFSVAPDKMMTKTPTTSIISRLNIMTSVLTVYASWRHHCRIRMTRFRLVFSLYWLELATRRS